MIKVIESLWQCYHETEFLFTQVLSTKLSFAIITAFNPQGELLSASQNRLLDRQLQKEIEALNIPYRAMIGASVDRLHMEKSWAVAIDKSTAIQLGRLFNQYAIYYVESGHLSLVPCLIDKQETVLGDFSERVNQLYEFPNYTNVKPMELK